MTIDDAFGGWHGGNDPADAPAHNAITSQDENPLSHTIFDLYEYPAEKKAKLAAIEFKGYAITWWNQVCTEYQRVGHVRITWEDMKKEMRRRFVPAYYSRDLHLKLKRLVQGTHTIDEYFQELEMCLLRTGITEDEESTMARFMVGLN